jgi:hypothetical protein
MDTQKHPRPPRTRTVWQRVVWVAAVAAMTGCVSPLRQAIEKDDAAAAEKLLAGGVNPNEADTRGFRPLHVAAALGRADMVVLLLKNGADPRLGNRSNKTPRTLAQQYGYSKIVDLLSAAEGNPVPDRQLAGAAASPPSPARLPSVRGSALVMELKPVGDVPAHLPSVVTRLVLAGLDDADGLRTVSPEDIQLMLSVEKQKDAMGCDEVRCIAELGGALGTDYVIYGQIGLAGTQYNLTLTAIDAKRSLAVARVSNLVAGTEDALMQNVPAAVSSLLAKIARSLDEKP